MASVVYEPHGRRLLTAQSGETASDTVASAGRRCAIQNAHRTGAVAGGGVAGVVGAFAGPLARSAGMALGIESTGFGVGIMTAAIGGWDGYLGTLVEAGISDQPQSGWDQAFAVLYRPRRLDQNPGPEDVTAPSRTAPSVKICVANGGCPQGCAMLKCRLEVVPGAGSRLEVRYGVDQRRYPGPVGDSYIRVIPTDLTWQPTREAAAAAVAYVSWLFSRPGDDVEEVEHEFYELVTLIDAGENTTQITCSRCEGDIEPGWFFDLIEDRGESFQDLDVLVPCCGAAVALNTLRYDWPVGFARFEVSAMNPTRAKHELDAQELGEVARLLGYEVTQILAHY